MLREVRRSQASDGQGGEYEYIHWSQASDGQGDGDGSLGPFLR
jgi:hypothetical protein